MTESGRIENLRRVMEAKCMDASIIFNFENQYYFSGLKAITYSRPIILIVEKTQYSLIIPKLEENHAQVKTDADHLHVYHEVQTSADQRTSYQALLDDVLEGLPAAGIVGIEYSSLPAELVFAIQDKGFELEDIGSDIVAMRAVKSDEEISMIRESGELVSRALEETVENTASGLTEMEIDHFGNQYLFDTISREYPASTLDYFVMSPSGIERTNMPHVFSNTKQISDGDIIIHSRQVGLNGYRAECERTLFVGEPTEQQKEIFDVMMRAQQAALDFISVDVTAKAVNQQALDVIVKAGYGQYIAHRTGHGIGIGLHEAPSLRFDNDLVLKSGMVFCVEPGIYVPGVGGFRHSDTVVLKEEGTEIITGYPRNLGQLVV
ncbi:M24 family metallopeptidase [Salinicoccus albus]|uniref:M24 family metallopeptidase n=1 Tax=Salinicoccus albus TaxID=418756 RepID=UPI00036E1A82|nr:Xaa-Pro peptidase family protein [Salinicoccus albus]